MKRTFIYTDAKSNKFWSIELSADGKSHTVTYGKVGTAGQTVTKEFASEEICRKAAEKLIAEKTGKGYVEQGVPSATASSPAKKPTSSSPSASTKSKSNDTEASFSLADFYGLPITDRIEQACHEFLTSGAFLCADIATGHFKINFSIFGALDKTLAGYVILADEGDDYTLLDLRDTGQIYKQDHEDGSISLEFANLDDYLDFSKRRNAKSEAYSPTKSIKSKRVISTSDLTARYGWLTDFFSNPRRRSSDKQSEWQEHASDAAAGYNGTWPGDTDFKVFAAEKKHLETDPHLALYWLLHAALFNWSQQLKEILAITARTTGPAAPLLASFTRMFGALKLDDDIPQIGDFRARRAHLYLYGSPVSSVDVLRIDSETNPVEKAAWVARGIMEEEISSQQISTALPELPAKALTTRLLQAALDISQHKLSKHADHVLIQLASLDVSFLDGLRLAEFLGKSATKAEHVVPLLKVLYAKDSYSPALLGIMTAIQQTSTQQLFEQPLAYYESVLAVATKALPIIEKILDSPKHAVEYAEKVKDPEVRLLIARRIAMRADTFDATDIQLWAARNKGEQLTRQAFLALPSFDARRALVKEFSQTIDNPDHPALAVMLDILKNPSLPGDPTLDDYPLQNVLESATWILHPHAHTPKIFDAQMRMIETAQDTRGVSIMIEKNFYYEHNVLDRLDEAQTIRVFNTLVWAIEHTKAHSAASSRLAGMNQKVLMEPAAAAIETYHAKYLDALARDDKPAASRCSMILKDVYWVLRNLKAESILEKQLFIDSHHISDLSYAIGKILTPEWHKRILALLTTRPEPRPIAIYASTVLDRAKRPDFQADLLRLIVTLPIPQDTAERILFKHALVTCILGVIDQQDYALVKQAHALAESIQEPAGHLDHFNPTKVLAFDSNVEKLKKILSGEAEKAAAKLSLKTAAATAAGKRILSISDAQLEQLGSFKILQRWFHDRTTGEVIVTDNSGNAHYFDGLALSSALMPVCLRDDKGEPGSQTNTKQFLQGVTTISQRILFAGKAPLFIEAVRYGNRVIISCQAAKYVHHNPVGIAFDDEAKAIEFMDRFQAHPPKGMQQSDPWYLNGVGAIRRHYDSYLDVLDNHFSESREPMASHEAAVAAHEKQALAEILKGRPLSEIEVYDSHLKEYDMTLDVWFYNITNQKHISYFTSSFRRVHECTLQHQLPLRHPFDLTMAPPATDAEIAVFAKAYKRPLPKQLIALWKQSASIHWKYGPVAGTILSPAEALASREATQAFAKTKLPKKADKDLVEEIESLYSIATDGTSDPLIYMSDIKRKDLEYAFAYAKDSFEKSYWAPLGWNLGYMALRPVTDAITADVPFVSTIFCGQEPNPNVIFRRFEVKEGDSGKFWEIRYDDKARVVATRYGKIGTAGTASAKRYAETADAAATYEKQITEKTKKGYKEVSI